MIEHCSAFQFGFYVTHGATPNPETLSKLISPFAKWELIPSTIGTFSISPNGNMTNGLQLQMIQQDKMWQIDFEPPRFLIQKNRPSSSEFENPKEFVETVREFIELLSSIFPCQASRLSFVTRGLLKEMTIQEHKKFYECIFKKFPLFNSGAPIEWSTRQVVRVEKEISSKKEQLNIITDLNRAPRLLANPSDGKQLDSIELGFDINTFQGNQKQRFSSEDVGPFLDVVFSIIKQTQDDVARYLGSE